MVHASNLRDFSDHEPAIAFFLDDGQRFHTFCVAFSVSCFISHTDWTILFLMMDLA